MSVRKKVVTFRWSVNEGFCLCSELGTFVWPNALGSETYCISRRGGMKIVHAHFITLEHCSN